MIAVAEIACIGHDGHATTLTANTAPVSNAPVADESPAPASTGPQHSGGNAPECDAQLRWFVLRHRPTEGRQAATRIKALGFQAHHFREEVTRRAYEDTLRAYFPGYLFVRFSLADPRWGAIMRLSPVTGILCSNFGRPVSVPDDCMTLVKSKFDERDLYIPETPPTAPSRVGQMFTVQVGSWARFMGQCVAEDPKGRISLLMSLFGRSHVQAFWPDQVSEA